MKKFKRIYIEITNICNLSCEFCPSITRKPEMMTVQDFENVLKQIGNKTDFIYLHVMGEPLLHPELGELLKRAEAHQLQVNLTTNGVLLEECQQVLLTSSVLRQVNISLHSLNANTNTLCFDDYLAQMCRFIQTALKQGRLYIALRLWNLDANVDSAITADNERIFEFISKQLGISQAIPAGKTAGNGIQLLPHLYLSQGEEFVWPSTENPWSGNQGFCRGLRDQVAILVNGDVVPCCLDSNGTVILGNVHQDSLENILNSSKAKAIVQGFAQRQVVEELCQKCSFRNRFAK